MQYPITLASPASWRARSALFSGCLAFVTCPAAAIAANSALQNGAMLSPLIWLGLAPCPAAIVLGVLAWRAEPQARGEALLGLVFGALTLLLMNCFVIMTATMLFS